jgi:hypothetical protein
MNGIDDEEQNCIIVVQLKYLKEKSVVNECYFLYHFRAVHRNLSLRFIIFNVGISVPSNSV